MNSTLPQHDIVLLGVGHTNAHVLRMWRMSPLPDARLTCVSNTPIATYSGMLPGTLAGLYEPERMQIDLVRLCAAAGARLILGEVQGLDRQRRELHLADRAALPYDVLSIGIGSVPRCDAHGESHSALLPVKPMWSFLARLDERLARLPERAMGRPLRLAVVGAGAGGVEIAFCLPARVRRICGDVPIELSLVDRNARLAAGSSRRAAALVRRELQARGVRLILGQAVTRVDDAQLTLADGRSLPVDLVVWVTTASGAPLLSRLGLAADADGFLLTRPTLQSVDDEQIFVVGDSGTCRERPAPKAGVYAVRQGPVLWENLRRTLTDEPLLAFQPQRGFLSLLASGDHRAILSYKGLAFHGAWCWRLKDRIDGRFMAMYQDYRPMPHAPRGVPPEDSPMRCTGCGGKVGSRVLRAALERLEVPASPHVLLGLETPDDAAILQPPGGRPVVTTVDFFAAPLDDAYLVGRLAALNAASDVFALGAKPLAALAMATIPLGPPGKQEQLLYELLAGALVELRRMGATLVGGHTIEGPQLTVGFAVLGDAGERPARLKSGLRPSDRLVLTKPLGTGVLLAAHAQARCRAAWFEELVQVMLQSNHIAALLADPYDVQAITDVTGFGLAGHLLEMLRASHVAAELRLDAIPLLAGFEQLAGEGVQSTLAPANRAAETDIAASGAQRTTRRYTALFDPQTCGGLLLGVPEEHVSGVLARLMELGVGPAAVIGEVIAAKDQARILLS
jgi:selenide, water dikinase